MNNFQEIKKHIKEKISQGVTESLDQSFLLYPIENQLEKELLLSWYKLITSFTFLDLSRKRLEEVYIHSPTNIVYKDHLLKEVIDTDITQEDLQLCFECLAIKNGVDWNLKNPFVSFYTSIKNIDVRVSLTHFSLSPSKKSKCFIRIQNKKVLPLSSFNCSHMDTFINESITSKKNILIAGSTGSGKTSFLNSILSQTDHQDHLIILEDVNEIISPSLNTTKLLAEEKTIEKSLKSYMNYTMRMSPDRIVLGEIRAHEVESYLLAMNTGHKGLLSTIHANSGKDALERVALLFKIYSTQDLSYENVLKLVCNNIDYVIFLKNKSVSEVINVYGSEKESVFFEQLFSKSEPLLDQTSSF